MASRCTIKKVKICKKTRSKKSKAKKSTRVVPITVLVKQMSKQGLKGPALMIAAGKKYRQQKKKSRARANKC